MSWYCTAGPGRTAGGRSWAAVAAQSAEDSARGPAQTTGLVGFLPEQRLREGGQAVEVCVPVPILGYVPQGI